MKKKLFIFIILAVLTANAFAETAFDYLIESLANVLSASTVIQIADYEYNGSNALWGTYLEKGKTISLSSQYDKGVEYLMMASAHDDKVDIDLKIYQGHGTGGTVITKDIDTDSTPLVRFTPSNSGQYTFELINEGDSPAFVSLVILKQKKGANFTMTALLEALKNTINLSKQLVPMLPSDSEIPANQWTLFGGSIKQGSDAGYYNAQLEKGAYILVGAGENSVSNCDVEVIEQSASGSTNGKKISQNTDSQNSFDFAVFSPNTSKYHYLKAMNKSSQNASAFMFGFLILAK